MSSMRLAAMVTVVVGLAIGAALAAWQRGAVNRPVIASAIPAVTVIAAATPTATAPPTHTAMPTRTALPPPAAAPAPTAAPIATAVPTPAAALATSGYSALQGAWQIDETNLQVGRMVWAGEAAISSGGELVLDVHKGNVAGRSATRCERQTDVHVAVAVGVAQQVVPFREVNCAGGTLSGEVRVSSFSGDGRSFYGSFWQGGLTLGDFAATKQ